MSRTEAHAPAGPSAVTCVWMDAGAVAFRLCDRGLDCEHCPFNRAMRGDSERDQLPCDHEHGLIAAWRFPNDRLYTSGHVWVQIIREGLVRTGIDAFAARLLEPVHAVVPQDTEIEHGCWCRLGVTGGDVPLRMPLAGRVLRWNDRAIEDPSLIGADPYGLGWLSEISPTGPLASQGLLAAPEALDRAGHDARFLRHNIAFQLIATEKAQADPMGATLLEVGRRVLDAGPFLSLARQFLH